MPATNQTDAKLLEIVSGQIKLLLEARDETAFVASRTAGLGESWIRDLERMRSKNPGICSLNALAHHFDVPLAYLVTPSAADAPDMGKLTEQHLAGTLGPNGALAYSGLMGFEQVVVIAATKEGPVSVINSSLHPADRFLLIERGRNKVLTEAEEKRISPRLKERK